MVLPLFRATLEAPFMRDCHVSVAQIYIQAQDNLKYWKERKRDAEAQPQSARHQRKPSGEVPAAASTAAAASTTSTAATANVAAPAAATTPPLQIEIDVRALEREVDHLTKQRMSLISLVIGVVLTRSVAVTDSSHAACQSHHSTSRCNRQWCDSIAAYARRTCGRRSAQTQCRSAVHHQLRRAESHGQTPAARLCRRCKRGSDG